MAIDYESLRSDSVTQSASAEGGSGGKIFFLRRRRPTATNGDRRRPTTRKTNRARRGAKNVARRMPKKKKPNDPSPLPPLQPTELKSVGLILFFFFLKKFPALNNGTASLRP